MNVSGLLAAMALLLPGHAQARIAPYSSCVALVLPRSAALDARTLEAFDRFIDSSWIARESPHDVAIYAPETRCHTGRCNAERTLAREEAIRSHFVGRGVAADRIRLIDLDEGLTQFGHVPERP
jgi:hypothetical protein